MLKILNTKTNIIFTVADETALKIMKSDRERCFRILDAGFVQEKEVKVEEKTVKELVMKQEQRIEDINNEEKQEEKRLLEEEEAKNKEVKIKMSSKGKVAELNYKKLTRLELVALLHKANVQCNKNETKAILLEKVKEAGL